MNSWRSNRFLKTSRNSTSSSQQIPAVVEGSESSKVIIRCLKLMNLSSLPILTGHCSSKARSLTCECMWWSRVIILCVFTSTRKASPDLPPRTIQMTQKYWGTSLCTWPTSPSTREMSKTMSRTMADPNLKARWQCHQQSLSAQHRTWPAGHILRVALVVFNKIRMIRMRIPAKSLLPNGVWHSWGGISGSDWFSMVVVRQRRSILLRHATMLSSRRFWVQNRRSWPIWTS